VEPLREEQAAAETRDLPLIKLMESLINMKVLMKRDLDDYSQIINTINSKATAWNLP
jgi:hypothetical protein